MRGRWSSPHLEGRASARPAPRARRRLHGDAEAPAERCPRLPAIARRAPIPRRRPRRSAALHGLVLIALLALAVPLRASEEHAPARFTVADFARFGVRLASAGPGLVDTGVELPGEVRPNPARTAHLSAQFAGRVREVRKRLGDAVRAGDVLAIVESDTLAPYPLTTVLDGVIVDQDVAPGETVGPGSVAFVVADLSTVWVEINVYQKDLAAVRPGERVQLSAGAGIADAEGTVAAVSPVLDQATRTAIARVVLPNPSGDWRPGLFVTARILDPQPAAVVVSRGALQRMDGAPVVFVVDGDTIVPRRVRVGRTGRQHVEILDGLAAGERYAADGTFLLKAELGAGAGGHDDH